MPGKIRWAIQRENTTGMGHHRAELHRILLRTGTLGNGKGFTEGITNKKMAASEIFMEGLKNNRPQTTIAPSARPDE